MGLDRKDLLAIADLSAAEIQTILETADAFKEVMQRPIRKVPTLRGKTVINFFVEASTRTRTSFELAAKYLSADVVNMSASSSSLVKGETLVDTALTLQALNPRVLIIRHSASGAAHLMARTMDCSVINAGDGQHEHPTQALLDMFTIREAKGKLKGLHVAIVGDILHSRVARSNLLGLIKMGAKVTLVAPKTLIPPHIEAHGAQVSYNLKEVVPDADIIMALRIQWERIQENLLPSIREYSANFCINSAVMKLAKKDALVMHPGPMNRGVEISPEVADGARSLVTQQVRNGLIVRMALLFLLCGGRQGELEN
jgi:aspartate carbamoyltransferase catalytic subunit